MNNGINNSINNTNNMENPNGMNSIQGNVPINGVPLENPNASTVMNQIPQGVTQVVNQMPMDGMQSGNTPLPGVIPQQPQGPANFVSPDVSNQIPQGTTQVINQVPVDGMQNVNMPMPGTIPGQVQSPISPMQNFGQPTMQDGMQPSPMMPNGSMVVNNEGSVNADGNSAGEKQKKPIVLIIITVLVVVGIAVFLILFLTGKINFGASSTNNQGTGNIIEDVNDVQDNNGLTDWMNYLLGQNITEITLSRYTDADGVAGEDTLSNPIVVTLTTEQLENIFTQMVDYNLVKYYASGRGMSTEDELLITYTNDEGSFDFVISGGRIQFDDNSELLELFENTEYTTQSDGETSLDGEDYNFILENFDNAIYGEYFEDINANEDNNDDSE